LEIPPFGDIALVVAGAVGAGFINGLTGMGYGLAALGLWLHAMSPQTAAPLIAICSVAGHIQSFRSIWHNDRWPKLWPILVAGLVGVPLGTILLQHVQVQPLKLGVGIVLVLYCAWTAFIRRPPIVTGGGRLADASVGLAGGVLGGMASVPGPAAAIWVQLRGWNKADQRGITQPYNMAILAMALASAAAAGLLDRIFLFWTAICLPSTLIGARIGVRLYGKVNDLQFRRIVLILLALSGATLIASGL